MMAKRKRAPGGGRKRLGPSVARNLTIRIDDELRERLEVEVGKRAQRRRNWNLSQEILMRLNQSLSREQERSHDPATLALTFLISNVAEQIHLGLPLKWHQNPFMFRAFKLAVGMVLDTIEPSGEMQTPYEALRKNPEVAKWFIDEYRTPETAALSAANVIMHQFFYPSVVRDFTNKESKEPNYSGPTADEAWVDREFYRYSDAKRALGIDKPKETKS